MQLNGSIQKGAARGERRMYDLGKRNETRSCQSSTWPTVKPCKNLLSPSQVTEIKEQTFSHYTQSGCKYLHVATRVKEGAVAQVYVGVGHDDPPEVHLLAGKEGLPVPPAVFLCEEFAVLL